MDSLDIDILKFMSERSNFEELRSIINKGLCVKESWELIQDFGAYFKDFPHEQEITKDFKFWLRTTRHPEWKPEKHRIISAIVDNVLDTDPPKDRDSFVQSINDLKAKHKLSDINERVRNGRISVSQAISEVSRINDDGHTSSTTSGITLADVESQERKGGLFWRLEDLNRSLGPLRKGDLIIVAKRPEVGGTSFLVSEMAHMLEQTNGNAIIFNNEESPSKVYTRMVSSALGVDYRTLMGDVAKHQQDFDIWLGESEWDLVHDTSMTMHSIDRQLKEKDYDIIGINVLLKVGGSSFKEDHDRLQELGTHLRYVADTYGPVLAIVQADPTAEGVQYIPQDRIYKSKTALQGEADGLIMIGTDEDIKDDVRYIHVAKNKIPPAACTDPQYKHIKSQVKFDPETGRFSSKNFTGNSRGRKKP